MKQKKLRNSRVSTVKTPSTTFNHLPSDVFDIIFSLARFNYAQIATLRLVCRRFDEECGRMLNRGAVQLMNAIVHCRNTKQSADKLDCQAETVYSHLRNLFDEYSRFIAEGRCCFTPGKVIDEAHHLQGMNREDPDLYDSSYWTINLCPPAFVNHNFIRMCSRAKNHFVDQVVPLLQAQMLDAVTESEYKAPKRRRMQRSSTAELLSIAPYLFYHKPPAEHGKLSFLEKQMHKIIRDQEDTLFFQKSKIEDLQNANRVLQKCICSLKTKIFNQKMEQNYKSFLTVEKENGKHILDLPSDSLRNVFSFLNYESKAKLRAVCQRFNLECQFLLNEGYEKVRLDRERSMEVTRSRLRLEPTKRELVVKFTNLKRIKSYLEELYHTYGNCLWENKCCFIAGKVLDKAETLLKLLNLQEPFSALKLTLEFNKMTKMASEHFEHYISKAKSVAGFSFSSHASCRSCWNREWRMTAHELQIKSDCDLNFIDANKPQVKSMLTAIETRDLELDTRDQTIDSIFKLNLGLRDELFHLKAILFKNKADFQVVS